MLDFKDYKERDKFDKKYYEFRTRIIDFYSISDCIDYFYSIWYISKTITKSNSMWCISKKTTRYNTSNIFKTISIQKEVNILKGDINESFKKKFNKIF